MAFLSWFLRASASTRQYIVLVRSTGTWCRHIDLDDSTALRLATALFFIDAQTLFLLSGTSMSTSLYYLEHRCPRVADAEMKKKWPPIRSFTHALNVKKILFLVRFCLRGCYNGVSRGP